MNGLLMTKEVCLFHNESDIVIFSNYHFIIYLDFHIQLFKEYNFLNSFMEAVRYRASSSEDVKFIAISKYILVKIL